MSVLKYPILAVFALLFSPFLRSCLLLPTVATKKETQKPVEGREGGKKEKSSLTIGIAALAREDTLPAIAPSTLLALGTATLPGLLNTALPGLLLEVLLGEGCELLAVFALDSATFTVELLDLVEPLDAAGDPGICLFEAILQLSAECDTDLSGHGNARQPLALAEAELDVG